MKIELWVIGKTAFPYLQEGVAIYVKRLSYYNPFDYVVLPDVRKTTDAKVLKAAEADLVLGKLQPQDALVLFDEHGKAFGSVDLSQWLETQLQAPHKRIVFLIGGAYGFDEKVYARANFQLSLSRLTFSHQMARLLVVEQLYRAFTILRGESYHNE